ncbi:reverse transcriptase domain-containing protein [Paludibacterium sp. B53371]|uniref:reverse transcriptase domain-containing protein n=1 Tax=Paludibacterium sp. B53371 TaxID=2806263 RepID=UPI001C03E3AE|nr:reverse transcriptase domain-containing protein [Paludibacterium sp. B53371]
MSAARKFKKVFRKRSLSKIYFEKIRETGAIGIDRIRPSQLVPRLKVEIDVIIRKIFTGTYTFTPYKEKLISKGQGVPPRLISIPTARDRIVMRGLCEFLVDVFPEAALTLPQAVIDSLAKAVASGTYVEYIKIDLKNFYPSIPHHVIFRELQKKIRKSEILKLLRSAIETATVPEYKGGKGSKPNLIGVPQGLAISNLLAEIALMSIDKQFNNKPSIWYKRYVDDILILVPAGNSKAVYDQIMASLVSLGLTPHALDVPGSKTKIASLREPFTFLGYQIEGTSISIRPESIIKFESSLASIFTSYRYKLSYAKNPKDKAAALALCRWRLNLRITGCIFEGRRLGWVFYFSQITNTSCLRSVNRTIDSLLNRFALTDDIQPKSLIKTYYEGQRKNKESHNYIPNFDTMPVLQQRSILSILLGENRIRDLSDKRISELFKMRISTAVRELEADLSAMS